MAARSMPDADPRLTIGCAVTGCCARASSWIVSAMARGIAIAVKALLRVMMALRR